MQLAKNSASLNQRLPAVYQQLLEAGDIAERHFRDVCDLEFTFQDGQLFLLSLRPARRSPIANLRFALQFLAEGRIGLQELLRRVRPEDVAAVAAPVLQNKDALTLLGRGLPASQGIVTGKAVFHASDVLTLASRGDPLILVRKEVAPGDLQGIRLSDGVLTTSGGVTSHAALICRQLEKPCVVGFRHHRLELESKLQPDAPSPFPEGAWITIDGFSGEVYEGKARFLPRDWRKQPDLLALSKLVQAAIAHGEVPPDAAGQVWRISDFFLHSAPLGRGSTSKKPVSRTSFVSFVQPNRKTLTRLRKNLTQLSRRERSNYSHILLSLMDTLFRLLSSAIGIGKHPSFFRPLWDPRGCMRRLDEDSARQFVGVEFFGINRHIPHLIDVATITLLLEFALSGQNRKSFLDFTNPEGESLVISSDSITGYRLLLNDAQVMHQDVPLLFNCLRRREYHWPFYEAHGTTNPEIIDFLSTWRPHLSRRSPLAPLCFHLGLVRDGRLTMAGESLIGELTRSRKYDCKIPNTSR